jgi:ribosome-associated toxin RatA of RatAB toxin-antitoxin module
VIRVNRSALIAHDAQTMFMIVADIEGYPAFLPWCRRAIVHERRDTYVRATLGIDFHGMRQEFTTANRNTPNERIDIELIDGPFRSLVGQWRFTPLAQTACKVELELAYEFASPLLERLIGPTFNTITNTLVDAFIRRAEASA